MWFSEDAVFILHHIIKIKCALCPASEKQKYFSSILLFSMHEYTRFIQFYTIVIDPAVIRQIFFFVRQIGHFLHGGKQRISALKRSLYSPIRLLTS